MTDSTVSEMVLTDSIGRPGRGRTRERAAVSAANGRAGSVGREREAGETAAGEARAAELMVTWADVLYVDLCNVVILDCLWSVHVIGRA